MRQQNIKNLTTEKDGIKKLFQGDFLVKFSNLPDFEVFAFNNNIIFVSDLSDIQRGVFKTDNLFNLEEVLTNLLEDPNIINIELNALSNGCSLKTVSTLNSSAEW